MKRRRQAGKAQCDGGDDDERFDIDDFTLPRAGFPRIGQDGHTTDRAGPWLPRSWRSWPCWWQAAWRSALVTGGGGGGADRTPAAGSSGAVKRSSCDRTAATPVVLEQELVDARKGDTICLAAGNYGTFRGAAKPGLVDDPSKPGARRGWRSTSTVR